MGSRLSCLRSGKHGGSHEQESRSIVISNAKKALLGLKNLIERSACKLKIKDYLGKSGCSGCACISSEKRTSLTNGLFKIKSFVLKGGGGGDHGGINKGKNINGGKNGGGGVDGKKGHDQKKQK